MAPFKVIIIGCGLAGGLLGNGLLQNDIDFTVYESDERSDKREGYQIRLGSFAIVGFKACLTPEQQATLYQMFGRSGGMIPSAPILYDTDFTALLDLTKFPAYTKSAPINRVLLRDYLQRPLDQAGKVRFGKKFTGYLVLNHPNPTSGYASRIAVQFQDGTQDECDLLISAEGSRSRINKQIGLDNIVQLDDRWGFLAKGSLPLAKLLALGPEVRRAPITVLKDGFILFYSAYLPESFTDKNKTATKTDISESALDFDEDMASLFWSLTIPANQCPENPLSIQDKIGFCLEKISNWDPRFQDMLRAVGNDDVYVHRIRTSNNPGTGWRDKLHVAHDPSRGNKQVWLLGDAIHAMSPGRGMGANQAMCDTADMLPQILILAEKKAVAGALVHEDFVTAVDAYEKTMIPRAFRWVQMSGGNGRRIPDPTSYTGRIMLFFVARMLDIAYLVTLIKAVFGFKPIDDAPELPN